MKSCFPTKFFSSPTSCVLLLLSFVNPTTTILAQAFSTTTATTMSSSSSSSVSTFISIENAGFSDVNGMYYPRPSNEIPIGFDRTCREMNWSTNKMWNQLSFPDYHWFLHSRNDSYIYLNKSDGKWWIDGPSGSGIYIVPAAAASMSSSSSPSSTTTAYDQPYPPKNGWMALRPDYHPIPTVQVVVNNNMPTTTSEDTTTTEG